MMTPYMTPLSFLRCIANLEQFRSGIRTLDLKSKGFRIWNPKNPGCMAIKSNVCLKKTENRTKESLTQLSYFCFG